MVEHIVLFKWTNSQLSVEVFDPAERAQAA